jgi:pyroglutamyl-peptidase
VLAEAPAAAFSTLPVKAMAAALRQAGHEATVSYTAGSFVCNQVFFALMQLPVARGGFLHLGGDLTLPEVVAGTRLALAAAWQTDADLDASAGVID